MFGINEQNLVRQLKLKVLGRTKPNRIIRYSLWIGVLVVIYYVLWYLLVITSVIFVNRISNQDVLVERFNQLGHNYKKMNFNWPFTQYLSLFSVGMLSLLLIYIWGLILTYRQSKWSIYVLWATVIGMFFLHLLFFGWDFMTNELTILDQILLIFFTTFISLIHLFSRKKH